MHRDLEKDLIEIEAAIKSNEERDNTFTVSVLQRAYERIKTTQWTLCSERLPIGEEFKKVIDGDVYYKHLLTSSAEDDVPIQVAWYDQENETWYDIEGFPFNPIAWMPLPEQYGIQ